MHTASRSGRNVRAVLTALLVLLGLLGLLVPPAPPALGAVDHQDAVADAAAWIVEEYARADNQFASFGTGVLVDIVIALAAAGTEPTAGETVADDLAVDSVAYIGTQESLNVGAAGKVVLAATIQGRDPTTFVPGRDVEAELRAALAGDGSLGTDALSHAYAVLGLAATSGGVPAAAGEWLADQQAEDGSFDPWGFGPDQDATAVAIQALLATGQGQAAADAVAWLMPQQGGDGSFGSWAANANTTGIVAQSFRAAGETAAADAAAGFVAGLQFGPDAGIDAGGLRWLVDDTEANGYATLQGILAFGAVRTDLLKAPTTPPPPQEGPFGDVPSGSTFEADIVWLADEGITRGCNPPTNDLFCPDDHVDRGQMAAFLVRALDYPAGSPDRFVDTAGSVFVTDINALAAAGVTRGCNPPTNDRFFPDRLLTRAEAAALLVRALDYPAGSPDRFVDTAGSVFVADIDALAAAGVTRGCNPPTNDRFCPDRLLTRAEMAALLRRALG